MTIESNFCVVPFYFSEISAHDEGGKVCCWLSGDPTSEYLQEQFLSGKYPNECKKCKSLEQNNIESRRQQSNTLVDVLLNLDLNNIIEQCKNNLHKPIVYQIQLPPTCNSTCITCNETASTAWQHLKTVYKIVKEKEYDIDYSSAAYVSFVGGEPLLEKETINILSKLNHNCHISIVTNGSVINNKILEVLARFKNIDICISIDGTNKLFEYLRYPLQWDTIVTNIEQFRNVTDQVGVSFTISNLNIMYYDAITKWFDDNGLRYTNNVVEYPRYFSPSALPRHVKDQIINKSNSSYVRNLLSDHNDDHDIWFAEAQSKLQYQDTLKGISMEVYNAELAKIFLG